MVKLPSFRMNGLETKVITHQKRVGVFDMIWRMMQAEENQLQLELDYNAALYTEKDIQTFVERFQHLMQTLVINHTVPLQEVDLLLPQDYALYQKIEGNAFYRLIKALLLFQKALDIQTKVDLVPINLGSEAIVGLACTEESKGETFHICNPIQLEWHQFIAHLKQTGYTLELIQGVEFMNLFTNHALSEEQRYALELLVPVLEETKKIQKLS